MFLCRFNPLCCGYCGVFPTLGFPNSYFLLKILHPTLWRNRGGALGAIVPPSRKSLPLLKKHKIENIPFVMSYLNFCPDIEKCHYLPILLKISIGVARITHKESFKDNDCLITI